MKDRILGFLRAENKSSAQFAEEIGVQASSISHIISGRNNPSLDFIIKMLSRYPSLSTDWLLFGKGQMFKQVKQQNLFENEDSDYLNVIDPQIDIELDNVSDDQNMHQLSNTAGLSDNKPVLGIGTSRIVYFFENGTFKEYYPAS
jgi:transcriptional regulator with XRE-family HTH domain